MTRSKEHKPLSAAIREFDVESWSRGHGARRAGSTGRVMMMRCPNCYKDKKFWISIKTKRHLCYSCRWGDGQSFVKLVETLDCVSTEGALDVIYNGSAPISVDKIAPLMKESKPFSPPELRSIKTGSGYSLLDLERKVKTFDPAEIPFPASFRSLPDDGNWYTEKRNFFPGAAGHLRLGECTQGWLRNRLIFPIFWKGRLVYYAGRDMTGKASRKVLNMKKRDGAASAGDVLLNMDRAHLVNDGKVVLVEGLTSAAAYGPDAVASLGNSLTSNQICRMLDYGYSHVVMAWDGDAKDVAEETAHKLSAVIPTSIAYFPVGADPSDLGQVKSKEIVANAVPVRAGLLDIPIL